MSETIPFPPGFPEGVPPLTVEQYEANVARAAAITAATEARAAEQAQIAALIVQATALRNTLKYVVESVPVAVRDPAQVSALADQGTALTLASVGKRDPELQALATECSNLTHAAVQQRAEYERTSQ